MSKEYQHHHLREESCEQLLTAIERLSRERWELVSVVLEPTESDRRWHGFFKRPNPILSETNEN